MDRGGEVKKGTRGSEEEKKRKKKGEMFPSKKLRKVEKPCVNFW
jgi:hypothetical protein